MKPAGSWPARTHTKVDGSPQQQQQARTRVPEQLEQRSRHQSVDDGVAAAAGGAGVGGGGEQQAVVRVVVEPLQLEIGVAAVAVLQGRDGGRTAGQLCGGEAGM